jgi:hypothetical protein
MRQDCKACVVSQCGFVWMFSPAWGKANTSEVLGYRWLEYVQHYEVPWLLRWFRNEEFGPVVFDAVEFGTLRACRISLVKHHFTDVLVCFGDRVLVPYHENPA